MAEVSIIMAVYNSQEYLDAAVQSILDQDYDDFELVLVDDGSTDSSGAICDRLAAEHSNVVTYHTPNGGQCHARNYALDRISSPYVGFSDNDDRYLPHLLRDNMDILHTTGADCVYYGRRLDIYDTISSKPRVSTICPTTKAVYEGEQIHAHYDEVRSGSDAVWACIYKRDVIEKHGLRFDERLRHGCEDILFTLQFLQSAQCVATNPQVYYNWIRRATHSSSFTITDDFKLGFQMTVELEERMMRDWGVYDRMPGYYADHMAGCLLNPLETALLAGMPSYRQMLPLFAWVTQVIKPYERDMGRRITNLPRRVFCSLVLNGHYRLAYRCMKLAAVYLSKTKR